MSEPGRALAAGAQTAYLRGGHRFCTRPQRLQSGCDACGLGDVRRVEVVETGVNLAGDVRKQSLQAASRALPVRGAESSARVVHRALEFPKTLLWYQMLFARFKEGDYAGGTLGHPLRRGTRWRRRRLDTGLQLVAKKGRHAFSHRQFSDPIQLSPARVCMVLRREVHRRFVDRQAEQAAWVCRRKRDRNGASCGMPIQMEPVEAPHVRGRCDSCDLGLDRITGRRPGEPVDLEVLGDRLEVAAEL